MNFQKKLLHDVIICVHNSPEETKTCLRSILDCSEHINKIIIVDDGSGQETRNMLDEISNANPIVHLIRNPHPLRYTKAANLGLRAGNGDVVTLVNSDAKVPFNWALRVQDKFMAFPCLGILGPLSNAASYQSVPDVKSTKNQTAINELPQCCTAQDIDDYCAYTAKDCPVLYTPLVHGFCFSISRSCLETVGLLDEELFPNGYGEETDYCFRAQDSGFALGVSPDIYVFHEKSKSYDSKMREKLMHESWAKLVEKYGSRRLVDAIQHMERQPVLVRMRDKVARKFYKDNKRNEESTKKQDALLVSAFYLPQFHPFDVNNEFWGEGFTEWLNVVRATPRFPGHAQPKLPGALGFYDLRLAETQEHQIKLAHQYGVDNFCMYYYRFGKKRIMDAPVDVFRKIKQKNVTYCLCWANESWTKAWDGATSDILLEQVYDDDTFNGIVDDVCENICSDSYLLIEEQPVFMVYQVAAIPNHEDWLGKLRSVVKERTGRSLLIGSVFSLQFEKKHLDAVDFVVQFPPHRIPRAGKRITIPASEMKPFEPNRNDYYESYTEVMKASLSSAGFMPKMLLGTCPDWDNTPRRKSNAHTLIGSTPDLFEEWISSARAMTLERYKNREIAFPMIFVNAWNEWAEGAFLEPCLSRNHDYLAALKRGLQRLSCVES